MDASNSRTPDPSLAPPPPPSRPNWYDSSWQQSPAFDPTWDQSPAFEPGPPPAYPAPQTSRVEAHPHRTRTVGTGSLIAVALVAAVAGGAAGAAVVSVAHGPSANASSTGSNANARAAVSVSSPSATATQAPAVVPSGSSAADIYAAVSPSIVTIEIQATANSTNPFTGQGGQQVVEGSGSGIILTSDGWILTNRHVAANADSLTVILSDGSQYDGTVKGVDTYTDFAIVKIDASNLPAVTLGDSDALRVGDSLYVIGNPLGQYPDSDTAGIVSGLDRSLDVSSDLGQGGESLAHMIQTDAAINPGNSGGAVVNSEGQVVGVATATSGQAQGISFALPVNLAKPIIDQVENGQAVSRPWLGVRYIPLDAQIAKDNNLDVNNGAWVTTKGATGNGNANGNGSSNPGAAVIADGPAAKAGLKDGDIITAVDGQAIDADHPLDLVLLTHKPGDKITLTVDRNGNSVTLDVTLGDRPASTGTLSIQ
jgi:S1-C subfamily serine protease